MKQPPEDPSLETMDEYRKKVENAMRDAKTHSGGLVFGNRGVAHAKTVISTMLENASDEVDAFSHELHKDVYSHEKLLAFLARNPSAKLNIIVEVCDPWGAENSALAQLKNLNAELGDRISVRWLEPSSSSLTHLCVVDDQHARIETSQTTREAVVVFGDGNLVLAAKEAFEALWRIASPISVRSGQRNATISTT